MHRREKKMADLEDENLYSFFLGGCESKRICYVITYIYMLCLS